MFDKAFHWLRAIHDRHARVILAIIATLLLPLMALTAVATLDNYRQNTEIKAATEAQDRLLACFDQYAAASSSSSKAVRIASVRKDRATAEAWAALNAEGVVFLRTVRRILAGNASAADFAALSDSLTERAKAGRKLERAQEALDRTREENPVPNPPSVFCDARP